MMIRIAVCEDEENTRKYLAALILKQNMDCTVSEYAGAPPLPEARGFDLLFLDIGLNGGMDGMELARRLRAEEDAPQPVVIFVTGYEKYVFDAFDVGAFQYLLKPVDEGKFREVFRRAMRLAETRPEQMLFIRQSGGGRTVPFRAVRYVESSNHKVILHLSGEDLACYAKIGDLERQLGSQFCRIHKGYLVNLACVDSYTRNEAVLSGGERLLISRYKYRDFVQAYLRYVKRGMTDE